MKSFKLMDRVVAISATPGRDGFAKGDKGTVVGTSPIAELAKKGVYVQFDLDSHGHCYPGRWFADFNQLELLPNETTPAGAKENMQQKLDEICARLEKIENLMVSAPMKEKVKKSKEPWYPPVPEGFSEWVEYTDPGMPIPPKSECSVLLKEERKTSVILLKF